MQNARRSVMLKNFDIKPPFFEVGPKAIIWGDAMLALAKVIDKTAMKYDVDVIVTPQYTESSCLQTIPRESSFSLSTWMRSFPDADLEACFPRRSKLQELRA
jgi:hypothetical protein